MKSIRVSLKKSNVDRSYSIQLGSLKSAFVPTLKGLVKPTRVMVVTSLAVAKAGHLKKLLAALKKSKIPTQSVILPNGEKHKTLSNIETLYGVGLRFGLDRRSAIIGLGGGVITDMAGFCAATYMRGINFVAVPTTLLGMVDAAIGGKTGVDRPEGKNLVGSFWQPRLVWIDPLVLQTLPDREWRTGMAEVIKYGVIADREFFDWLEKKIRHCPEIKEWRAADLTKAILTSAALKAKVVSGDERESPLKGGREILNFGHTAGHALEAATKYGYLSHGEAISVGMIAAGRMALELTPWSKGEQLQLLSTLETVGLPIHWPFGKTLNTKKFWNALLRDKKNIGGKLRFVLPLRMGKVKVVSGIEKQRVQRALRKVGLPV